MDILILDRNFKSVTVIDAFESFLWVDRYCGFGDCEIFAFPTPTLLRNLQLGYYIYSPQSDRLMVIDERILNSDIESGNTITIRGRSLESILEYRIMWEGMTFNESFQDAIYRILNENVINPSIPDRRIPNFIFQYSTDPRILDMQFNAQISPHATGANIYETIRELCEERKLGFKIILNDQNQFIFNLYMGTDRSFAQDENPHVIFSPNFDNIINSNYLESDKLLRNVSVVAGEDTEDGTGRRRVVLGSGIGLERRELFIDARDVRVNAGVDDTPRVDTITGHWLIAAADTDILWEAFPFVDPSSGKWHIGSRSTSISAADNPHLGSDNTWIINNIDTRIKSPTFPRADIGTNSWIVENVDTQIKVQDMPHIRMFVNIGFWYIGDNTTAISVQDLPYVSLGTATWFIEVTDTKIPALVVPRLDLVTGTWFIGNIDTKIIGPYFPYANINTGTWFIGSTDTRITIPDIPYVNIRTGTWFVGDVDTKIISPTLPHVNQTTNHWFIGGIDTNIVFQEYLDNLDYIEHLIQRGNERSAEYVLIKTFEGDVEVTQTFKYGEDFFLGDIVQIVNEFDIEASTQIVEIVHSFNDAGNNIVPTFRVVT